MIVELLFGNGADVNTQGGEHSNVLQAASFGRPREGRGGRRKVEAIAMRCRRHHSETTGRLSSSCSARRGDQHSRWKLQQCAAGGLI